jgi:hypothetical protein
MATSSRSLRLSLSVMAVLAAGVCLGFPVASLPVAANTLHSHPPYAIHETSYVNNFIGQVNTIGILRFPNSYEGVKALSARSVIIFATQRHANLMRAITKIPRHGIAIHVATVSRSYGQLEKLTLRIAHAKQELAAEHVTLQAWGPDPSSDTVRVTLASAPQSVSAQQYVDHARSILDRRFGSSWITVSPTMQPLAVSTSTRSYDTSPVRAGDFVYYSKGDGGNGDYCTDAFGTTGNKSGNTFILSAGHCGPGPVVDYLNEFKLGTVSTQYLSALNGDNLDFETIGPSVSASGKVWYGADGTSDTYDVTGVVIPPMGSEMTVDGDGPGETGQICCNVVGLVNGCINVVDSYYGTYQVCDIEEASDNASSGPKICIPGDSSGPAYVRITSPDVKAAGTIVATNKNEHECFFQEIWKELSVANLSLIKS